MGQSAHFSARGDCPGKIEWHLQVMANTMDRLDALAIQNLDHILGNLLGPILLHIRWLVRATIPQHIRDDQAIALLREIGDLMAPIDRG